MRLLYEQMGYTSWRKDIAMASQRFLVPIDFSEYANQALEYAINLAGVLLDPAQGKITVLDLWNLLKSNLPK